MRVLEIDHTGSPRPGTETNYLFLVRVKRAAVQDAMHVGVALLDPDTNKTFERRSMYVAHGESIDDAITYLVNELRAEFLV